MVSNYPITSRVSFPLFFNANNNFNTAFPGWKRYAGQGLGLALHASTAWKHKEHLDMHCSSLKRVLQSAGAKEAATAPDLCRKVLHSTKNACYLLLPSAPQPLPAVSPRVTLTTGMDPAGRKFCLQIVKVCPCYKSTRCKYLQKTRCRKNQ